MVDIVVKYHKKSAQTSCSYSVTLKGYLKKNNHKNQVANCNSKRSDVQSDSLTASHNTINHELLVKVMIGFASHFLKGHSMHNLTHFNIPH